MTISMSASLTIHARRVGRLTQKPNVQPPPHQHLFISEERWEILMKRYECKKEKILYLAFIGLLEHPEVKFLVRSQTLCY